VDDYRITSPLGIPRKRWKQQFWVASERADRPIFCQEEEEERERERIRYTTKRIRSCGVLYCGKDKRIGNVCNM